MSLRIGFRVHPTLLTLAGMCFSACGAESAPAIHIELVPDSALSSPDELGAMLSRLVLVADRPGGLYPPGAEVHRGNIEIRDADRDPTDLELVATVEVGSRLPTIRIERGSLPVGPIDLHVTGESRASSRVIAEGRARGLEFSHEPPWVSIPFNLRSSELPPRVAEVIPASGVALADCKLPRVVIALSKPIEPESAFAPDAFRFEPGGAPTAIRVDASGLVVELRPPPLDVEGDSLSYRLIVGDPLRDEAGRQLDQAPAEPGLQPYVAAFEHPCVPPTSEPDVPQCGDAPMANGCPFPSRLRCIDGLCVPATCAGAVCEAGLVCDAGRCSFDCRTYGSLACHDAASCDEHTGRCSG